MFPSLAALAWFTILFTSAGITVVCALTWVLLLARMWRDFRPSKRSAICGTVWTVLTIGTISGLCGLGAYTIAVAAATELLGMLP